MLEEKKSGHLELYRGPLYSRLCRGGAVQSKLGFLALFFSGTFFFEIFNFFLHHHEILAWTIHNSKKKIDFLEKKLFRPLWVHFMTILGNFGFWV